jgi:GntR family transcriptional repressor for pyruvate dehydrogenase complex
MKRTNPIKGQVLVNERMGSTKSLTDRVTEVLMEKISKLEFPHSQLPTEQAMCERFGVSRSVIREALSRLKSKGLVVTRQGSGSFISQTKVEFPFQFVPDTSNILKSSLDVIELRQVFESEIASLAAIRHTKRDLAQIRKAFREIKKALAAGKDGATEDLAFNLAIAHAAKNSIFPQVLKFVSQYIYYDAIMRLKRDRLSESNERRNAEHAAIVKAIELRDPKAAEAAVRKHLASAAKLIKESDSQFWIGRNG